MFDIIILTQYCHYYGQEPTELDREAIKRYLTTDESWLQHRWVTLCRKLQFPFSIALHDGPYRPPHVIEGCERPRRSEDTEGGRKSLEEEDDGRTVGEAHALLSRVGSAMKYGTQ